LADFVAQNAYYHLGESYLNTDKQASKCPKMLSDFDFIVYKDASLNYAKLSHGIRKFL
jgi:hypothetical protein